MDFRMTGEKFCSCQNSDLLAADDDVLETLSQ